MNNNPESNPESREKNENTDMEKDYNKIIDLLHQNKNKSKFITNLWEKYLAEKKKLFEQDIKQCYRVINILNEVDSNSITTMNSNFENISQETITLLKIMYSQ
jgi:hypothetical protein